MKKFDNLCCATTITGDSTDRQLDVEIDQIDQYCLKVESNRIGLHHPIQLKPASDDRLRSSDSLDKSRIELFGSTYDQSSKETNSANLSVEDVNASHSDEKLSNIDLKIGSNLNSQLKNGDQVADRTQVSYSSSKIVKLFNSLLLLVSSAFKRFNHQNSSVQTSFLFSLAIILLLFHPTSAGLVNSSKLNRVDTLNQEINSNLISDLVTANTNEYAFSTPVFKRTTRDEHLEQFNIRVSGFRIEGERVEIGSNQITSIYSDIEYTILLYGINFSNYSADALLLSVTPIESNRGEDCSIYSKDVYNLTVITDTIARTSIKFDSGDADKSKYYYICIDYKSKSVHQGDEDWLRIHVQNKLLPLWLQIFFIFILLCLAGLFSGLNLGRF